jgi:hypothetical protein
MFAIGPGFVSNASSRNIFWYDPLFANGEIGMVVDFNDLSTLFQDTAHSIPVTAVGNPIKSAKCKRTGAFGIVNYGSAQLAYDSTNKKFYAQGDASFNLGFAGSLPSAFAQNITFAMIAVCYIPSISSQSVPIYIGPAYPSNPSVSDAAAVAQLNDSGYTLEFLQFGFGNSSNSGSTRNPPISGTHVLIGNKTPTGSTTFYASVYTDGVLGSGSGITGASNIALNLDIGRGTSASNYYSSVIVNRPLTSTEISTVSSSAL